MKKENRMNEFADKSLSLDELLQNDQSLKCTEISNNHWKEELRRSQVKATDLRIGNIITHGDYSDETFEVIKIEFCDESNTYLINTKGGKNGTWGNPIDLIKGIKLTKEWLLKFGFAYDEEKDEYYLGKYKSIRFDLETNQICFCGSWDYPSIDYVHQLQNFYKEVDGEILKEKKDLTKDEIIDKIYEDLNYEELMYALEMEIKPEEAKEFYLKKLPIDRLKNIYKDLD